MCETLCAAAIGLQSTGSNGGLAVINGTSFMPCRVAQLCTSSATIVLVDVSQTSCVRSANNGHISRVPVSVDWTKMMHTRPTKGHAGRSVPRREMARHFITRPSTKLRELTREPCRGEYPGAARSNLSRSVSNSRADLTLMSCSGTFHRDRILLSSDGRPPISDWLTQLQRLAAPVAP